MQERGPVTSHGNVSCVWLRVRVALRGRLDETMYAIVFFFIVLFKFVEIEIPRTTGFALIALSIVNFLFVCLFFNSIKLKSLAEAVFYIS